MRAVLAVFALVAVWVQAFPPRGFRRRTPIGDEIEYLARARGDDPYGPAPFLRVPLFITLVRLARGNERSTATLLAALALVAIGATATAAGWVAGTAGVLVAGGLYLTLPDRWLLSRHLWPDTLLAVFQSLLLLVVVAEGQGIAVSPWLLGGLAALAAMTRIDALVLVPALVVEATVRGAGENTLALALPSALSLGLLSLWNGWRYGRTVPDTTVAFNWMVLAEEQEQPGAAVEQVVGAAWARWNPAVGRASSKRSLFRRPGDMAAGALRRLVSMLGPDTFGRERLLGGAPGAYPELGARPRRWLQTALRWSFPALVALAAGGAVAQPTLCRGPLVLALATFLAGSLVHARTRYRYALLPHLAFCGGLGLLALSDPEPRGRILVVIGLVFLLTALAPARTENAQQPAAEPRS